jgi:antitoxin YefM
MKTATVSDFRSNMRERLDELQRDQDILILSGPKNKDFVLLTLEAYNAMEETAYLLATPANTSRLLESISQDKAGKIAHSFTIDQFEKKPVKQGTTPRFSKQPRKVKSPVSTSKAKSKRK